jgi:hypothetical protein
MQLHGDHPIRHGFSAIGVQHGQHGGYHTGPCGGTNFPHLGISVEGTQWALARAHTSLDNVRAAQAQLAGNPDLTWYPTNYSVRGKPLDMSKPVTLKYGEEVPYEVRSRGVPSYASEHRQRKAKLDAHEEDLVRSIAAYEKVIASWSPGKYPTTGAPKKIETVHMERPIRKLSGDTFMGIRCRSVRRGGAAFLAKTDDPSKVTCKRCRAALGLPPA